VHLLLGFLLVGYGCTHDSTAEDGEDGVMGMFKGSIPSKPAYRKPKGWNKTRRAVQRQAEIKRKEEAEQEERACSSIKTK